MDTVLISVGMILADPKENKRYRVIAITSESIVLCEMDISTFELIEEDKDELLDMLLDEQVVIETEETIVFDIDDLSQSIREKFEIRRSMMQEVVWLYEPSFMGLTGRKARPELKELMKKYSVPRNTFWRVCIQFFQSGMKEVSLVDKMAFGVNKGKDYQFKEKPGKKPQHIENAGVVLTEEVLSHFEEALKEYKSGRHKSVRKVYARMNYKYYRREELTMTRREQIMLLNRSFHKPDMSNQISHSWISKIYVYPECMERDKKRYGESYIHVQHQLSGVTTCYKHKCKLLKYAGIPDQVCEYNPENFREEKVKASQRSLEAYTEYAHRIYQSNVSSSVILVRRALLRRIKEAGYDIKKESAKLMRELEQWEYKDLLVGHVKQNPRLILEASYSFPVEEFIPLAMFFFPDVEEFIRKIASSEPFVFERSCSKCGNKYYNSPQAIEDGWGVRIARFLLRLCLTDC